MKKAQLLLVIFALFLFLAPTTAASGNYSSYAYYIRDFNVEVTANPDRSYDVTEIITVWFNEERRGIMRDIPTFSSVEQYSISDVSVTGAPFTVTDNADYISVRIGDPDVYITGEKTYTIKYTRRHFADGEPDFDYFYMDLIGDGWDAPIADFSAVVRLPEDAEINEFTVTSGSYSVTSNDYAVAELEDNVIRVGMKQPLEPYMAVTLNVEMLEGAFSDAPVFVAPFIIHSLDISASIDRLGVMEITETYDATVNDPYQVHLSHGAYSHYSEAPYCVFDGPVFTDPKGAVFDSEYPYFLHDYTGERVKFIRSYSLSYRITEFVRNYSFVVPLPDTINDAVIESYSVSVLSPFEISGVEVYESYDKRERDSYSLSIDGGRMELRAEEAFNGYFGNYVVFDQRNSGFVRTATANDFILPLLTAAIAALLIFFAFIKNPEKPLVAAVEFYPPGGMNPAEAGYVIDSTVSSRDVTSLIYYWASHGHLLIELPDKSGSFVLHKRSNLDNSHQQYEVQMFDSMFSHGANGMVSDKNLEEKFYSSVNTAASAVRRSFKGMRAIEKPGNNAFSRLLCVILVIFYIVAFAMLTTVWKFARDTDIVNSFLLALISIPLLFSAVSGYRRHKHKGVGKVSARLIFSLFLALVSFILVLVIFAGKSLSAAATVITAAAFVASSCSAAFLRRKTDFGLYLLDRCVGFKLFLTTAEKSRLEMLLEDNP
ncbi:MAG: DUF2207 domain-containing protein, partial [Oscillospiraceae bacterium]|nr:DUF2207 domain-containing protein [Oscillospiraceae bacterium]